jgi:hypothetical protein
MKKEFTGLLVLIFVLMIGNVVFGQPTHTIDFEPAGVGATWDWTVAENDDNPPLEFIANPVSGGINTSPTVAKFIARQTGNPWALFFTDDDGEFTFDATNSTVKIMVYKPVISPVHFKVEGLGPPTEIVGANTVINQWEEITFDFSGVIGETYNRLVILPDLYARPQENTIYIDNIQVPDGVVIVLPEPTVPAPAPTVPAANVISIFSDAFPTLPGVNLNPNWGQSTEVTFTVIQGDTTMKYGNLNYQGTELNQNLNLDSAGMQYIHIDVWNANSTDLNFFLISPGPNQQSVTLVPPDSTEQWRSVLIPLTSFQPTVDLTQVFQMMFTGNGTIYLDNIYFWDGIVPVELTMFTASVNDNDVQLNWTTATEKNNSGFQVERKSTGDFESIGFVPGSGTTIETTTYSFSDVDLNPGNYYYRLKQIDYDGSFEYSDAVEIDIVAPGVFSLNQNYPNPFNPSTKITFSLATNAGVTLRIFDALGQEVVTLINQELTAGVHTYDLDATDLNSGVYVYKIEANGQDGSSFINVKKMIVLK